MIENKVAYFASHSQGREGIEHTRKIATFLSTVGVPYELYSAGNNQDLRSFPGNKDRLLNCQTQDWKTLDMNIWRKLKAQCQNHINI